VGPSHARTYTVAVYFKGERIGCGKGPRYEKKTLNFMEFISVFRKVPTSAVCVARLEWEVSSVKAK
jgi:hypothetical protein